MTMTFLPADCCGPGLRRVIDKYILVMKLAAFRKRSPWILHYNAGGCNGCDIELLACLGPKYDIERFGVINTGNPKQSDILLVTGPVTKRSRERLVEIYSQMPEPKVVISCGACACTGGGRRTLWPARGRCGTRRGAGIAGGRRVFGKTAVEADEEWQPG